MYNNLVKILINFFSVFQNEINTNFPYRQMYIFKKLIVEIRLIIFISR